MSSLKSLFSSSATTEQPQQKQVESSVQSVQSKQDYSHLGKAYQMVAPEELEKYTCQSSIESRKYDEHGNEAGEEFDLGADGAFGDFSVLLGLFYSETFTAFKTCAGAALHKKGFRILAFGTGGEAKFVSELKTGKWDCAWVVSDSSFQGDPKLQQEFVEQIIAHHKAGKGLMLWGDNDPYNVHANLVLPQLANCNLSGCDSAQNLLKFGAAKTKSQFDSQHIVFAGINQLYEGHTIAVPKPVKGSAYDLKVMATSSDNNPCILYRDGEKNAGRIIVDTGFTKLYLQWTTAGQSRYVVNASVWLINIEDRVETESTPQ